MHCTRNARRLRPLPPLIHLPRTPPRDARRTCECPHRSPTLITMERIILFPESSATCCVEPSEPRTARAIRRPALPRSSGNTSVFGTSQSQILLSSPRTNHKYICLRNEPITNTSVFGTNPSVISRSRLIEPPAIIEIPSTSASHTIISTFNRETLSRFTSSPAVVVSVHIRQFAVWASVLIGAFV
jgi:hypothetical protein